jgi:hypothetical protein
MAADKLTSELLDTKRARAWRELVLNRARWTGTVGEAMWDDAVERGLAIRRASKDQRSHAYTLTNEGLDFLLADETWEHSTGSTGSTS